MPAVDAVTVSVELPEPVTLRELMIEVSADGELTARMTVPLKWFNAETVTVEFCEDPIKIVIVL